MGRFLLSLGHVEGFCMMCTMESHINQVLCCSNNAIKPTSVINGLKSKLFDIDLFLFFKKFYSELFDAYK